jgi:hypothetical protein
MNTSIITVVQKKKKLQAVQEKHAALQAKQPTAAPEQGAGFDRPGHYNGQGHEQREGQAEQRDHQGQVEGDHHPDHDHDHDPDLDHDHDLDHVAQQVLQARQPTAVPEQEVGFDRPGHYNGQGAAGEVVANDDYAEDYPGHVHRVRSVERRSGPVEDYWEEFQPYQKKEKEKCQQKVCGNR